MIQKDIVSVINKLDGLQQSKSRMDSRRPQRFDKCFVSQEAWNEHEHWTTF